MFHLVCVVPFDKYSKGQAVTDPAEVDRLSHDRGHHFVRIAAPDAPEAEEPIALAPPEDEHSA